MFESLERSLKISLVWKYELEVWSLCITWSDKQILFWCLTARRLDIFLLCNWINTNLNPELLPSHNIGKCWSQFWISCEFASWKIFHLQNNMLQNCLVCAVHCFSFRKAVSKWVNRGTARIRSTNLQLPPSAARVSTVPAAPSSLQKSLNWPGPIFKRCVCVELIRAARSGAGLLGSWKYI